MKVSFAVAMLLAPCYSLKGYTGDSYDYPDKLKKTSNEKVYYSSSKNDKNNYEEADYKHESNEKTDD